MQLTSYRQAPNQHANYSGRRTSYQGNIHARPKPTSEPQREEPYKLAGRVFMSGIDIIEAEKRAREITANHRLVIGPGRVEPAKQYTEAEWQRELARRTRESQRYIKLLDEAQKLTRAHSLHIGQGRVDISSKV